MYNTQDLKESAIKSLPNSEEKTSSISSIDSFFQREIEEPVKDEDFVSERLVKYVRGEKEELEVSVKKDEEEPENYLDGNDPDFTSYLKSLFDMDEIEILMEGYHQSVEQEEEIILHQVPEPEEELVAEEKPAEEPIIKAELPQKDLEEEVKKAA